MAQFTVHKNTNPQTRSAIPFLLDVQSDLLSDLETRVVVPLCPASAVRGKPLRGLTPVFQIEGESYIMLTPQLAGIPRNELGAAIGSLERNRFEIVAAIDFLVTGI